MTDFRSYFKGKKIGQSYELYGKSKLAVNITDSSDKKFTPEFSFLQIRDAEFITLSDLVKENPADMLGEKVYTQFGEMPLLIKFTQALGNSFQLHIKPDQQSEKWQPKAESWYYFEKGLLTFGIKKGQ